jgi:hypothetical protein
MARGALTRGRNGATSPRPRVRASSITAAMHSFEPLPGPPARKGRLQGSSWHEEPASRARDLMDSQLLLRQGRQPVVLTPHERAHQQVPAATARATAAGSTVTRSTTTGRKLRWRAFDATKGVHENSVRDMRCLASGGLELKQVFGRLDCSGTGPVKQFVMSPSPNCAPKRSSSSLFLTGPIAHDDIRITNLQP